MATVRRVLVEKKGRVWTWQLEHARWQFRILPEPGLWRNGSALTVFCEAVPLLCVDDAVVFSKGLEAGIPHPVREILGKEAG